MSTPIFDPDKCPVPAIDKLPRDRFITDCTVPDAPDSIQECPDTTPPEPALPLANIEALVDIGNGGGGGGGGGGSGECPISVGAICTETFAAVPIVDTAVPASSIYFRKDSSFRVWGIPSQCPGQADVLIDIGGGPPDSVFWQPFGGGPPRWTQGPGIGSYLTVGTVFRPGWIYSVSEVGGFFGMAAQGSNQFWRMPPAPAPSHARYLMVDAVDGACHGLAWSERGVNTTLVDKNGYYFTVRGGLITDVTSGNFTIPEEGAQPNCLAPIINTVPPCFPTI
jgi:hypothetical protein